jgi:hypothetical protein
MEPHQRRDASRTLTNCLPSAISSAIEAEKSETGGKRRRTRVNRVLRQVAESERVGDQRIKSANSGKTVSRTPTLSANISLPLMLAERVIFRRRAPRAALATNPTLSVPTFPPVFITVRENRRERDSLRHVAATSRIPAAFRRQDMAQSRVFHFRAAFPEDSQGNREP